MMHRYFLIEPSYSDPDTFCSITVGSGRTRANIQIYIDEANLADVVYALTEQDLKAEFPVRENYDFYSFDFHMSILPSGNGTKIVRFQINQGMTDDQAPFFSDIRFFISEEIASEFARDLEFWLERKTYPFEWKP